MTDTRTRILDTAERLFADQGIAQTSLRSLTTEAEVNLAAVHYYFGSRDALIREVFARRIVPVNEERLRRLDVIESEPGPPELEAVIDAFVSPAIALVHLPGGGGRRFVRILARIFVDPTESTTPLLQEFFPEVAHRFIVALCRSRGVEVGWDSFFDFKLVVGVMVHALTMEEGVRLNLPGACADLAQPPLDPERTRERVVAFVSAGLRAIAVPPGSGSEVRT